jgi:alkanesulfonate monooxygenase SsuD/methylene tetrahydromethanopterin reductase-like flavin-dependent oxidoreductase (luciferase family)
MSRIGIAISGGPNPAEIVDLAESLGYESAWVAEGHGGDQFAILAACATRTSRILLGTSISSVFVRTAPTIAMAASTVADMSGGRFILGLGSSHKVQVEPEHGVAYGKPLTRTRETVAIVRELIREGRVRFEGETTRIENFDLWYTPRHRDVPVYLSAVFAKGIALCGEVADGIILTRSTLRTVGSTSRWRDEALLRQAKHRAVIARAIRDAIKGYFDVLKARAPDADHLERVQASGRVTLTRIEFFCRFDRQQAKKRCSPFYGEPPEIAARSSALPLAAAIDDRSSGNHRP